MATTHPLRIELNDEIHGRSGYAVHTPCTISHYAHTLTSADADPLAHLASLCSSLGLPQPASGVLHHGVEREDWTLRFERHGEFFRVSFISKAMRQASQGPLADWFDTLPGKRMVAISTVVVSKSKMTAKAKAVKAMFNPDAIAGSAVSQQGATIMTDFRIGTDGYTHMLVINNTLTPIRLGRVLRRVHEIETYRMMALLALPVARDVQSKFRPIESALSEAITAMSTGQSPDQDAQLLTKLSALTRDVEEISNTSSYRFAAANAYSALVRKRLDELGEERLPNLQRIGVFLDRRFSPAMATCTAVSDRVANLAARCSRANDLLRTRVDIALEKQNQDLLRSMDARARQQLTLQETVEGFSVVAISYYLLTLLDKAKTSLIDMGLLPKSPWLSLIAIPIVMLAVWFTIKRLRGNWRSPQP